MLKYRGVAVWSLILMMGLATGLAAQNFVYTNNDQATANSISAFSVDANGSLSPISGSPFSTGGAGHGSGLYSASRIVVDGNFLYASNAGSNNVSAFSIGSGSGVLSAVAGSPFPTGALDDTANSGISLAVTPDGKFLYAGSTGLNSQFTLGSITIFSINSTTGALAMVGTPVAAAGAVYGMKVSPDDKYLVVALFQTGQIAVYAIQPDGTLQAVANSPFTLSSGAATSVDINCAGNLLFAGGNSGNIYAFSVASGGQLSAVAGSPFATGIASNQVVTLGASDGTLFSSNQGSNTVTAFSVGSDGSLNLPGTSAGAGSGALYPGGLSVSEDGSFLYAADTALTGGFGGISTFTSGGSSLVTFASLTSTGVTSQTHSVAAYPAKTCASAPAANDLTAGLQVSTSRPPRFELQATLSLGPSLVVNPLIQPVGLQIGDYLIIIPAGSLKFLQNGPNGGTYLFQGPINGSTFRVQIAPLGENQFEINVYGNQVDLSGLLGPVTVTVGIGDNSASTSVTPVPADLRGNWRDF
ncbi:MAG TPA: beta-propeller fold lactonase family protein [Terriglobia bacterium]|nr:beta-propeller fold lactonase family protein [Terriglobia bacterium]